MTGEELWTVFLGASVPNPELEALGYDLFWQRAAPTGRGAYAIDKLAQRLSIAPKFTFAAFNINPGRPTLQTLAREYIARTPWASLSASSRDYASKIGHRIGVIRSAIAAQAPKQAPIAVSK